MCKNRLVEYWKFIVLSSIGLKYRVIYNCSHYSQSLNSLIMMINLIFIIFFYIKHLILWGHNEICTSSYVTASGIAISICTSWIKFCRRIKAEVLMGITEFKFINVLYMHSAPIYTRWSLLLLIIFISYIRIPP